RGRGHQLDLTARRGDRRGGDARMTGEVGYGRNAAIGDLDLVETGADFVDRGTAKAVLHELGQLPAVLYPQRVAGKARIRRQPGIAKHAVTEGSPLARVLDGDQHLAVTR